jgi:diguanylate cyclase (GGDEF)-like protein/PAS domain S-box-containing protein
MPNAISAEAFSRRFRNLILLTWTLPPVVGLGFLIYIQMFSIEQMRRILTTPLQPTFIIGWILFSLWYFPRYVVPVRQALLSSRSGVDINAVAVGRIRHFPLHFWTLFCLYILMAPTAVIISAQLYTDFSASPVDWFRIHLVALVVSILVGTPIFLRSMDLFGLAAGRLQLDRPVVSLKAKVMLLGALMPLLVDTMLVQYYWTRTGFFSLETFHVWLALEMLAVVGSLLLVRSLGQSLWPLSQALSQDGVLEGQLAIDKLTPRSTDELGLMAASYQTLLHNAQIQHRILRIGNRLVRQSGELRLGEIMDVLVASCAELLGGDLVFLQLYDAATNQLVGVAQTDGPYREAGYYRLGLEDTSMAVWAFKQGESLALDDVAGDPRVSPTLREHFGIKSALASPLRAGGETIGVLMTVECQQHRHYCQADVTQLEQIASEAALAIATHRLLMERTEAQAASMANERQVRLLLDSTVEAIYGADTNGICTLVNRACLEMLGYAHEDELLGKSIHELIHHSYPDGTHYPKQDCVVRLATLRGDISHSTEEVHWRKDGTPVPVEFWSHPVYLDGKLMGSVVTFIDISERRAAEQHMQQLLARNALLLESTSDGIIGVDTALCCTFANHAAAHMLGYSPDEVEGRDLFRLAHDRSESGLALQREELPLYRAIAEQTPQHTDNAVLWQRNGDYIPVQYSANPIHEEGRVTGAVMVFRNVAEARAVARKMDYLATHDALTGLFNRREFENRLEQSLLAARRNDTEHALCYLDLDQFKVVNDTCGHEAGDELLRQLASLLHGRIRQHDMLARLGGDEFGMLLDSCPISKALTIADQVRALVEDYRFAWGDKTFAVGVSIGLVAITAETESQSWALSAADTACYMAKDSGRNRVHVHQLHDDELNQRRSEMQWVARLNEALDQGQFVLRYQPIVAVKAPDEAPEAIEILVAMQDEQGLDIPPGAFIPAAERYSLMSAIDRWVVGSVFAWLRDNRHRLDNLKRCFINLSGQSVGQEKFLDFLLAELDKGGFPTEKLCFEITETAAVANLSRAVTFIKALKSYGCRFALDDFGSGMSSFAYLKNLPLDYLKIDGNFVRDMVVDPIDRAMVQAIHQVGHVMNIGTIAEFVEQRAILDELGAIGVDYAQGYAIARPQPLDGYLP